VAFLITRCRQHPSCSLAQFVTGLIESCEGREDIAAISILSNRLPTSLREL